jgi:signal transduction histidine kinase
VTSFVRAAWDLPRAAGAPRRVWRDWALVGVLVPLTLLEALLRPDLPWLWVSVVIQLGLIATLLWRRTHPGLMLVIAFGSSVIVETIRAVAGVPPTELYSMAFLLILPYALVRWGSGRDLIIGGAVLVVEVLRTLLAGPPSLADTIGSLAVLTATAAIGATFRYRAGARAQRIEQARLQERERLARDLHDTVAHHVSAIAIRAQAGLATSTSDPDAAPAALHVIESEAAHALRELRSMVGGLRQSEAAALAPVAGMAELRALTAPGAGLPVALHLDGPVDELPATIATTLYRVTQESITNARRHAAGATVIDVDLRVGDDSVALRVHDDGQDAAGRRTGALDTTDAGYGIGGYGIVGMGERVALLGGTFRAGPDPAGGWTVEAELPRSGGPR